ncbi:MAG: hypothetical protein KDA85_10830 [Planctomycetaceae bacterium]|nr:hypothetical protein [Planctomycetaceae bacterium]
MAVNEARRKRHKESSLNALSIIVLVGGLVLFGGAGAGLWKLPFFPERASEQDGPGNSRTIVLNRLRGPSSLPGHSRGQYGPFVVAIPDSAGEKDIRSFTSHMLGPVVTEYPLLVNGTDFGRRVFEWWEVGDEHIFIDYTELKRFTYVTSIPVREYLAANDPCAVIDAFIELQSRSPRNTVNFEYQPSEDFNVNGLRCARRTSTVTTDDGRKGILRIFACRIGSKEIVLSTMRWGTTTFDPADFQVIDAIVNSLRLNSPETVEE